MFCKFSKISELFSIQNISVATHTHRCVRSHWTLAMIMVNLAKSWLTMVPLSRSWQIMMHWTLVTIMARPWQDNYGLTCELLWIVSFIPFIKLLVVSNFWISRCDNFGHKFYLSKSFLTLKCMPNFLVMCKYCLVLVPESTALLLLS